MSMGLGFIGLRVFEGVGLWGLGLRIDWGLGLIGFRIWGSGAESITRQVENETVKKMEHEKWHGN